MKNEKPTNSVDLKYMIEIEAQKKKNEFANTSLTKNLFKSPYASIGMASTHEAALK